MHQDARMLLRVRLVATLSAALALVAACSSSDADTTSLVPDGGSHGGTGAGGQGGQAGQGAGAGSDAADGAPPSVDADAAVEAGPPAPFRVVTWNVHDLYDDVAGNCDCQFESTPKTADYQAKIDAVSKALASLAGDVAMLQEVENAAVLDKLATSPLLAPLGYKTRVMYRGNDPRGINIAFLSKLPIDGAYSHKDDKFTRVDLPAYLYQYTRDALEVHMTVRGQTLVFFGVHFKAKSDPDDPDRRLAEAQHTRQLADAALKADPSAYVWVLGDFNDAIDSPPYTAVRDGVAGPAFLDAGTKVAAADRWTYSYQGNKVMIDHLFASPGPTARLDDKSATVTHDKNQPSDHAPVAATFLVP
jgi:endonuclease/exonuclease/phosphatase family metal-dependent hydrolase